MQLTLHALEAEPLRHAALHCPPRTILHQLFCCQSRALMYGIRAAEVVAVFILFYFFRLHLIAGSLTSFLQEGNVPLLLGPTYTIPL